MSFVSPHRHSEIAQRFELEHGWEFLPDPSGRLQIREAKQAQGWRPARAGVSWNVQFDDLRDYMGAAWYRIEVEIPTFADTRHVLLKFGAVDYYCEVFVNEMPVGIHEGGYTPFTMEITSAIRPGMNEIAVRVVDPPMDEQQNRELFPDMMYNEIPHGKQNWYVQNSGIWQGVRLELCPSIYINGVDVTARIAGDFDVDIRLAGVGLNASGGRIAEATDMELVVRDGTGAVVFRESRKLTEGLHQVRISGQISDPKLWGPDSPHLYLAEVSLKGAVQYRRRVRFGFRLLEAREGKLYLNGAPFYMVSTLDQDFYPETIHTPFTDEIVREMMLKARQLGINVLRCHLKVAHPVYLDVADEIGMLVWAEMPSWSDCWFPSDHFSMIAAVRCDKMFSEILERDWNHPCLVIQTIMNESWGINLKDEGQRRWLRETFDRTKEMLRPLNRLVVDNSACEGNFHIKTDLEDFHNYYSMPDQVELWEKWLAELAARPDWTFSPYGDAERTRQEPIIVSEFGNWGLPKLPRDLPWWFHTNFGDREATRPSGVLERFRDFGFDKLFGSYNELAEETQWHQYISLKHEIESIRSYGSIQGYVITGMTDVHWEVNGLLDMWRNPKVFAAELAKLQQPDLVLARVQRHSYFAGEQITARIYLSHYSMRDLGGARLQWWVEGGERGEIAVNSGSEHGQVIDLGEISFKAPQVSGPSNQPLHLELRSKQGRRITENTLDLFILPQPAPGGMRLLWRDPAGSQRDLGKGLRAAGYEVSNGDAEAELLVSTVFDEFAADHLQRGGRALFLLDSADAMEAPIGIALKERAKNEFDGRWFSNYNWIQPENPAFATVNFGRILGFESEAVVPRFVIRNVAAEHFDDVLSGATFGWLNLNSALTLQVQAGEGRAVFTVFRFERYGENPYATQLLNSLIRYASSDELRPRMTLDLHREVSAD